MPYQPEQEEEEHELNELKRHTPRGIDDKLKQDKDSKRRHTCKGLKCDDFGYMVMQLDAVAAAWTCIFITVHSTVEAAARKQVLCHSIASLAVMHALNR